MSLTYELNPYTSVYTIPNWNGGILLGFFNPNVEGTTSFKYFNSTSRVLENTFVPTGNFTLDAQSLGYWPLIAGANSDVWALTNDNRLFYFSGTTEQWYPVSFAPIYRYNIEGAVWDPTNQQLLVYVQDYTVVEYLNIVKIVRVNTDVFPPSGTILLNYLSTFNSGVVGGIATVEQDGVTGVHPFLFFSFAGQLISLTGAT